MADQKMAKELREGVLAQVEQRLEADEVMGRTSEGVLLKMGDDFVVVRAIVKAETFDAETALADFADKQLKAAEKAKEKAAKVAKAKAKEKEGE